MSKKLQQLIFLLVASTSLSVTAADFSVSNNYLRLNNALTYYKSALAYAWPTLISQQKLQLGVADQANLLLRARLRITRDLLPANDNGSEVFDEALEEAVKLFQWRHGLKVDGIVGTETLAALNVSPAARIRQIEINLKRFEKLSKEVTNRYLLVNVPEYQLHLIDDNKEVLNMKVIVGKPQRPTPNITSTITRLVINPYWRVPRRIAQNDIIPKIIADPDYLRELRIRVFTSSDATTAKEINPTSVNWLMQKSQGFRYFFRQEPGLNNALGQVKFEFVNNQDIYLHDTPVKSLFAQYKRAFSSGCIRLEKPFDLVDYFIKDGNQLTEEEVKNQLDTIQTKYFSLKSPLPIIITYLTAWVDENGIAHFANDIYGQDKSSTI